MNSIAALTKTNLFGRVSVQCGGCVLWIVHFIYSISLSFLTNTLFIFKRLRNLYRRTFGPSKMSDLSTLREVVERFPKVPKHVAVVLGEETISYHDCIKLILWCINSGIPFISFYNHNSAINPTSLYEVLCKTSKPSLQCIKWGNTFHKSVTEMAKKDINGYSWRPVTEINLFSCKTVHETFGTVMLQLCRSEIDPDKLSIAAVDRLFKNHLSLPDPCFAFIFGESFSTQGFLPWQIRVTEFYHLPTHHNLAVEEFVDALQTYARCEQRLGK